VRAPFAGLVLERVAEPGEVVAAGAPLLSLIDPSGLRVRFEVVQGEARALALRQEVEVELDGDVHRAALTALSPGLVGEGRLRQAEATLEAPPPSWLPGAFVRVAVALQQEETARRLPLTAIRTEAGVTRAFVVADARAQERLLTVLRRDGDGLLVAAGVEPGERVLTQPPPALRDGDEVTP
jgi:RND family efflux transporter MFP subunit